MNRGAMRWVGHGRGDRLALIGLLLALAFLVHDGGMTANVHAGPGKESPPAAGMGGHGDADAGHHGGLSHSIGAAAGSAGDVGVPPDRLRAPNGCDIAPDVARVMESSSRPQPPHGAGFLVNEPPLERASAAAAPLEDAPTRSPAVRRALFQVYRI